MVTDFVLRIRHRNHCVWMTELNGVGVELGPLIGAEQPRRRHLQDDCLRRDLDGRHRDLVVRAEIRDRLDLRVTRYQQHRLRRGRNDALHAAFGAVPQ